MAIVLRDYQREALASVQAYRASGGRRALVAMATGLGKTMIFSQFPALAEGRKVLVMAHREELLDQAAGKIAQANPGIHVAVEQAARHAPATADVVVASVQTLSARAGKRLANMDASEYGIVVVDEAHHAVARTYMDCLAAFGLASVEPGEGAEAFRPAPSAPLLVGFTATPNRSDKSGLDAIFDEIVYSMDIRAGMEAGWLCPIRGIRIQTASDLDTVRVRAGDFAEGELSEAVNTPERNALAVTAYREKALGRQALVFCVDVAHTRDMLGAFRAAGVQAEIVVGGTPVVERVRAIAEYQAGRVQVLVNCMVLTEGFDAPETSCIVMARPTKSSLLYTQMLGRGTRISPSNPSKELLVIDMVDVARRAGIANLNTMFGLPPRFKLREGEDILTARRGMDALEDQIPETEFAGIESLDDARRVVEEFDPLRQIALPEWLALETELAWTPTSYGYALSVMSTGNLGIEVDMLDHVRLRLKRPGERPEVLGNYPSVLEAVRYADRWVMGQRQGREKEDGGPSLAYVMRRDAHWRQDSASDKQIALLHRLGVQFPPGISKGQASGLIDRAIGAGRKGAYGRK